MMQVGTLKAKYSAKCVRYVVIHAVNLPICNIWASLKLTKRPHGASFLIGIFVD